MDKFTTLTAQVMPLPLNDIDTDVIIPAQYLTSTDRGGYGEKLFRRVRDEDPTFPLNQERYQDAKILVSGRNFGCGSSREHAVWALSGAGFRVVIAKSFADIFASNSAKNGLLLVVLPEDVVDEIMDGSGVETYQLEVNLVEQNVVLPTGASHSFEYDQFRKHCLLHGLDDLEYILAQRDAVESFRAKQEEKRFYTTIPCE